MGSVGKRVETDETEMSEADAAEIRKWEALIERDRREGWFYGTPNVVNFDEPNDRCWATEIYGFSIDGRTFKRRCLHKEQTDIGLCNEHYEEIVGANIKQES